MKSCSFLLFLYFLYSETWSRWPSCLRSPTCKRRIMFCDFQIYHQFYCSQCTELFFFQKTVYWRAFPVLSRKRELKISKNTWGGIGWDQDHEWQHHQNRQQETDGSRWSLGWRQEIFHFRLEYNSSLNRH